MTREFERNLEKYAEVIVKVGLNLQPGQRLMIGGAGIGNEGTPLEAYPLVRQIAKEAYLAGAKYVAVNWDDEELQRIRVQHAAADTMSEFATWKNELGIEYVDNGDAVMMVFARNPELMGGLDPEKVQAKLQNEVQHIHRMRSKLAAGATNWLLVGASITSWAAKIFPDMGQDEAVSRLWETIFEVCRINQDDPVAAWESHISELDQRSAYLNDKKYSALKYTAAGTNLTVGLPGGHIWRSASLTAQNGITSVVNIPTEEVLTMPHKGHADGVVTATKPLSYGGSLIENFRLEFSAGRVVEATAEAGQSALDNLLGTDEASRSLGEVALVPHSSPISQSNLLFYNTLFDENASSHLALGNAYRFSMEGGEEMSAEGFAAAGGNESLTHADFMIGSEEMNVDGLTAGGTTEAVMRHGEWAFEV
jgi:aminopeptidase